MNNTLYVPCKAIINTAATANISLYNILSMSIGFTVTAALSWSNQNRRQKYFLKMSASL